MLQSKLFTKTRREEPADEEARNAKLLIKAGFIAKEMAGVYSFLPLGLRVINKIADIIRQEMNAIAGQEVYLSTLQNPEIWKETNRWSEKEVNVWFKTKLAAGGELGLGFTHEEPLTRITTNHISSYKDLPKYIYQIQPKFRNELRAKSGLLRGREFLMKDLYSFNTDEKESDEFYERAKEAYFNIFSKVGLGNQVYLTFASGGVFSQYSHEFQAISEVGEDTIYIDEEKKLAINKEIFNPASLKEAGLQKQNLKEAKAIEVGNIFKLGTRFSEALGLYYQDEVGKKKPVFMGSYGIGLGRLMATVVESYADEEGLVWPEAIAPFKIHLVEIAAAEGKGVHTAAEKLYEHLQRKGREVLFDDRDLSAGEKFADADLLGLPYRLVVSEKTIKQGKFELKERKSGKVRLASEPEVFEL